MFTALRRSGETLFLELSLLPLSLPLDCWCDSWPGGGGGSSPSLRFFVPLPIQHLPKAQCSSSTITANSHRWQPSLHFTNATLSAASRSDSKWQLLPQSPPPTPRTRSCLCGIADMLRVKIDCCFFLFFSPCNNHLRNNCIELI